MYGHHIQLLRRAIGLSYVGPELITGQGVQSMAKTPLP